MRVLLQHTNDAKTSKERMHIDLETDDVEAEVQRLDALGAKRWDHQLERGYDFWVLRDPWENEVLRATGSVPRTTCSTRALAVMPRSSQDMTQRHINDAGGLPVVNS
jgi:hypothetical protein